MVVISKRLIKDSSHQLSILKNQLLEDLLEDRVVISTQSGVHILDYQNIIYLKAESNYCTIFQENGDTILISKTLKYMEEAFLRSSFYRVHASYLINLKKLKEIRKNGSYKIVLSGNYQIPISSKYRDSFMTIILSNKV